MKYIKSNYVYNPKSHYSNILEKNYDRLNNEKSMNDMLKNEKLINENVYNEESNNDKKNLDKSNDNKFDHYKLDCDKSDNNHIWFKTKLYNRSDGIKRFKIISIGPKHHIYINLSIKIGLKLRDKKMLRAKDNCCG